MFYSWQERAVAEIAGKSAILSAPTGSGKTWVAYRWAGLMDEDGNPRFPVRKIIFTAPIKALSNERYMELRRMGFDVGLETGDFKKNVDAFVLCCTQEIYTLKYAHLPDQRVIIDEFHFIFNSSERTRAYVDGIRATHRDSEILVMSATFGDPQHVRAYLEEMGRRDFALFETNERVTKLVFRKKGARLGSIHDALVFVFSRKWADYTAAQIAKTRRRVGKTDRERLVEMADILEIDRMPDVMTRGVGIYHGGLYPKEKLFVEMAFRERILDVVVGTDALSLGVNLPAETVVFGQMAKFIDGPLTHNEFLQMAGRAGRKGYFDTGYVTFVPRSKCENYDYDTETLYREILNAPSEPAKIVLRPAVGRLLKREVTPQLEAEMISGCSLPKISFPQALAEVEELLFLISETLRMVRDRDRRKKLEAALADLWFDEMGITANIGVANLFVEHETPNAMDAVEILKREERNDLQALLKVKRYANRMPEKYRFANMSAIDATVERIDATVFGFEEKIRQLTLGETALEF